MPVYISSTDSLISAKVAVIQILYICTPEWKSLLCLLRQWGFIDLLQSWQITFSLVWWIFLLCLHKVPSVAAWKSHFAHGYFWWKCIEFVSCCKLPFVVNEYSQKLQLNLILSWSDFLWLKTLLLLLKFLLHILHWNRNFFASCAVCMCLVRFAFAVISFRIRDHTSTAIILKTEHST